MDTLHREYSNWGVKLSTHLHLVICADVSFLGISNANEEHGFHAISLVLGVQQVMPDKIFGDGIFI
jgi:hypothetical protein